MSFHNRYSTIFFILFFLSCGSAQAAFTFVNTHPEANSVYAPGSTGRGIKGMLSYNNRIYFGYGANGAIATNCPASDSYFSYPYCDQKVRYLDASTGNMSGVQQEIRSQGMLTLDILANNIYLLAEDRDDDEVFVKCTPSSCAQGFFPTASENAHLYVSAEYQGSLYMAGGHNNGNGAIWKSTNNGATWAVTKYIPKINGIPCCARVQFMAVHDGSLYAQATQYNSPCHTTPNDPLSFCVIPPQTTLYKLTGSTWTTISNVPVFQSGYRTETKSVNEKTVYQGGYRLREFTNTATSMIYADQIWDYTVAGEYAYILDFSGKILQSKNLQSWTPVEQHNTNARQLEIINGALYVGDKDGHVWISDNTFPRPFTSFLPSVYYLLED